MTNKKHKSGSQGFTLIELLIVVALLGALAALVLPSMQANRTKAMEATCDFNQISTIKALNDHYVLNGALPDMLHTGAEGDDASVSLMNLPSFTADNIASNCTWGYLTATEVASVNAAGLTQVVYSNNTAVTLADDAGRVAILNNESSADPFVDDAEEDVTFNGHHLSWWESDDTGAGGAAGRVFLSFISPITDWSTSGDNDWGKSLDSSLSVKKAGECRVPVDEDFTYYVAYIKAFSAQVDGEDKPAILVGTSCPECGITNP